MENRRLTFYEKEEDNASQLLLYFYSYYYCFCFSSALALVGGSYLVGQRREVLETPSCALENLRQVGVSGEHKSTLGFVRCWLTRLDVSF